MCFRIITISEVTRGRLVDERLYLAPRHEMYFINIIIFDGLQYYEVFLIFTINYSFSFLLYFLGDKRA